MTPSLETLLRDNQSGSNIITTRAFELYADLAQKGIRDKMTCEEIYLSIHAATKTLIKEQPNMVLLRRSSNTMLTYLKRLLNAEKPEAEITEALISKIAEIREELESNSIKTALNGARVVANSNKILTISNSTIVHSILLNAHTQKRRFEVFCLKSHPPDEGIAFAEALAASGIKTTLIADSQLGVFLPEMNFVLTGADRIFENGFVNKAGTLPLCLTAKFYNVPVYLAAETTKILYTSERAIKNREAPAEEVYTPSVENLHVENRYYEKIPLRLTQKVICENSLFETHEFVNWYLKE